jgi:four helix bundle protein
MKMKENIIKKKSFEFALKIIELYKMMKSKNEFVISKQLIRAGTSIGANINEAEAAQSKADFIHKMSIASKEARESKYWLMLLQKSRIIEFEYISYIEDIDEIINILTSIVKTSQERLNDKNNNSKFKTQNAK